MAEKVKIISFGDGAQAREKARWKEPPTPYRVLENRPFRPAKVLLPEDVFFNALASGISGTVKYAALTVMGCRKVAAWCFKAIARQIALENRRRKIRRYSREMQEPTRQPGRTPQEGSGNIYIHHYHGNVTINYYS